jgi:hypothetical protein
MIKTIIKILFKEDLLRKTSLWLMVVAVLASGMLVTSCGSKEKATSGGSAPAPSATMATNPQQDYTRPYLNDEKMSNFIASLKEERNPFELVFKEGGQTQGLADLKDHLEDYNAFARKYGFQDYGDYMAVWGRITVGELLLWSDSMKDSTVKMYENNIKNAEEALKNPNLDPEMKKMYEDQIADGKKSLEDMQKEKKDDSSLNAADLELVKKYKDQIDQESEKYKKNSP